MLSWEHSTVALPLLVELYFRSIRSNRNCNNLSTSFCRNECVWFYWGINIRKRHFLDCNINCVTIICHVCVYCIFNDISIRTPRGNHYTGRELLSTLLHCWSIKMRNNKAGIINNRERYGNKILIIFLCGFCGEKITKRPVHRFHISLIPVLPLSLFITRNDWNALHVPIQTRIQTFPIALQWTAFRMVSIVIDVEWNGSFPCYTLVRNLLLPFLFEFA